MCDHDNPIAECDDCFDAAKSANTQGNSTTYITPNRVKFDGSK